MYCKMNIYIYMTSNNCVFLFFWIFLNYGYSHKDFHNCDFSVSQSQNIRTWNEPLTNRSPGSLLDAEPLASIFNRFTACTRLIIETSRYYLPPCWDVLLPRFIWCFILSPEARFSTGISWKTKLRFEGATSLSCLCVHLKKCTWLLKGLILSLKPWN